MESFILCWCSIFNAKHGNMEKCNLQKNLKHVEEKTFTIQQLFKIRHINCRKSIKTSNFSDLIGNDNFSFYNFKVVFVISVSVILAQLGEKIQAFITKIV